MLFSTEAIFALTETFRSTGTDALVALSSIDLASAQVSHRVSIQGCALPALVTVAFLWLTWFMYCLMGILLVSVDISMPELAPTEMPIEENRDAHDVNVEHAVAPNHDDEIQEPLRDEFDDAMDDLVGRSAQLVIEDPMEELENLFAQLTIADDDAEGVQPPAAAIDNDAAAVDENEDAPYGPIFDEEILNAAIDDDVEVDGLPDDSVEEEPDNTPDAATIDSNAAAVDEDVPYGPVFDEEDLNAAADDNVEVAVAPDDPVDPVDEGSRQYSIRHADPRSSSC